MNSTFKTILCWVLVVVTAVALYNFVEHSQSTFVRQLGFTQFMAEVTRVPPNVKDVVITGTSLKGHLAADNSEFQSVVPADYPPLYDKLIATGIDVKIESPNQNSWLGDVSSLGLPTLLVLGFSILWLAISAVILVVVIDLSRFVKRELERNGGKPSAS